MTIFEDLIPEPLPAGVKVLYGTVTGSSPLRVQVDRDPGPLPVTPTTTVACAVGDRVVMLSHVRADNPDARARAVVILGRVGGDDTGWLDHGGTLAAGWQSSTASPIQYRVLSGVCYWRGIAERTSGTVATGYVVTALPSQVHPASSGAALNFAFETGAGTVSGGAYPDAGGSLYIWASGTLASFRIGGSYPIG